MNNVDLSRVPPFYHNYINNLAEPDLMKAFQNHQVELLALLIDVPDEKWSYRYASGKWSIKEMVQHIIDADRIFCYRALRFARKDKTELPGFDEDSFAAASAADRRTKENLLDELTTVQKSAALLFSSFNEEHLNQTGTANGNEVYVEAIGFIIIGHTLHHKSILQQRYLS
ncbi:MAG: DinB family protein [Bacteroidota bacterium]